MNYIIILLYISFGIGAVITLIKEFRKPEKKYSIIVFEFLILLAVTIVLYKIVI